jgi:hypothetical protein
MNNIFFLRVERRIRSGIFTGEAVPSQVTEHMVPSIESSSWGVCMGLTSQTFHVLMSKTQKVLYTCETIWLACKVFVANKIRLNIRSLQK